MRTMCLAPSRIRSGRMSARMIDEIEPRISMASMRRKSFATVSMSSSSVRRMPGNRACSMRWRGATRRSSRTKPGTTRDLIEVVLDLDGLRVRVTDTAGMREAPGKVEAIGIEKARANAPAADLVLCWRTWLSPCRDRRRCRRHPALRIGTKVDLAAGSGIAMDSTTWSSRRRTARGWRNCWPRSARRAAAAVGDAGDILPSRLRHVELLKRDDALSGCGAIGRRSRPGAAGGGAAAGGRSAWSDRWRGRCRGLLDVIFSQFCIGK